MQTKNNLIERKEYLRKIKVTKASIIVTQISIIITVIILWWSKFLSKVAEPFLVVLNSLPKIALRASYNNMGWSRNFCNYCNGTCNCDGGLMATNTDKLTGPSKNSKKWD